MLIVARGAEVPYTLYYELVKNLAHNNSCCFQVFFTKMFVQNWIYLSKSIQFIAKLRTVL